MRTQRRVTSVELRNSLAPAILVVLFGCSSSSSDAGNSQSNAAGGGTGMQPAAKVGGATSQVGAGQSKGGSAQSSSSGQAAAIGGVGNTPSGSSPAAEVGGASTPTVTGVAQGGGNAPIATAQGGSTRSGAATAGKASTGVGANGGRAAGGSPAQGGRTSAAAGRSNTTPGGRTQGATGGSSPNSSASGGAIGRGGAPATGSCALPTTGHYQMENLDRGVIAVKVSGGVYVGWRMMGYEYDPANPSNVSYNLYKGDTKLATVTDSTNYVDAAGTASSTYSVAAVINGTECTKSEPVTTLAQNYLSIPLSPPAKGANGGTYDAGDGSTGDLDGDGQLDIVLKWDPTNQQDNSKGGVTDNVFIDGYTLAGKRLFRIDLGPNIRAGAHYTQLSVYDFDGDGKAEIAVKTAPGTKDGSGAYLKTGPAASDDDSQIYRNTDGYVLTGPEYLTVFSGSDGAELATVNYPVLRGTVSSWGDSYGNRVDRFNGGVAFVKEGGKATGRPSIITQRGYYTRMTIASMLWRDGKLTQNWLFDSNASGNSTAAGQGDHAAMAADADGDGGQEIITGATTISSDGKLQCTTGLGHGDAMDVSELVPGKGISVFSIHEGEGGMDVHDAATCAFHFKTLESGVDSSRGRAEYVGAGNETSASCSCSSCNQKQVLCANGTNSGPSAGSNFVIYWDADEWRELENGTSITKASGSSLLSASGCSSNNGTKSTPTLTADLFGDWREEIVFRTSDNSALRVYTTTAVTARRIYTLMHDPTYRVQVAFENSSYNQPPHPGFRISPNMDDPPVPDIHVK